MSISREAVRQGYLFILGREPESEAAVAAHSRHADIAQLRTALLKSEEFRIRYVMIKDDTNPHPYATWTKKTLAFIHVPKTGGTTLHNILTAQFPANRICPTRSDNLLMYSPSELARYDLFSGHFSQISLRFIPRQTIRRISIFREPGERLISWYRFCRSHPVSGEFSKNMFIKLANELTPEEFFEHAAISRSPAANNLYMNFFSGSPLPTLTFDPSGDGGMGAPGPTEAALDTAIASERFESARKNILGLDAMGITERFDDSVRTIFMTLGLRPPEAIPPAQVTDELPKSNIHLSPVPRVFPTPRLLKALRALTQYDRALYDLAVAEFERRHRTVIAQGGGSFVNEVAPNISQSQQSKQGDYA